MEDVYMYNNTQMESNLQIAKGVILESLRESGHITKEVYDDYMMNFALIVKKPSFFSKVWDKLLSNQEERNPHVVLVKQMSYRLVESNLKNTTEGEEDKYV